MLHWVGHVREKTNIPGLDDAEAEFLCRIETGQVFTKARFVRLFVRSEPLSRCLVVPYHGPVIQSPRRIIRRYLKLGVYHRFCTSSGCAKR